MNYTLHKTYSPIIFLLTWLGLTVLTFLYGPYEYKLINPVVFFFYIILIHLALFLGYKRGQRSKGRNTRANFNYFKFIKITILISLFYLIVKLAFTSGGNLHNFIQTFNNASETYGRQVNLFSYLDMLFGPISIIAITNTIFSYKNLPKPYRYSVYLLIAFSIASAISSATRSGIVQILIISITAFSLGIYKKNIILKYYQKVTILVLAIILGVGFLVYSSILVTTRGWP